MPTFDFGAAKDAASRVLGNQTVWDAAAKAFGPIVAKQVDILWPKIDAKIDAMVPQLIAALVKVLNAQLPQITDKIIDRLMADLPEILERVVRAVVPDAIEKGFPVDKIVQQLFKRLTDEQGLSGIIGGLLGRR